MAAIHVAYGESTTKFKATLLAYLQHYSNDHRNPDIDESLNRWVQHVKRANFEHIRYHIYYTQIFVLPIHTYLSVFQ